MQIAWDGGGHNVLEVFDEQQGWVIYDPSFGAIYGTPAHPERALSVAVAVGQPTLVATRIGLSSGPLADAPREIQEALFPDPWLYTRSGTPAAHWPFRGRFVHVGAASLRRGRGQELARGSFLFFAFLTLLFAARLVRVRRSKSALLLPTARASVSTTRSSTPTLEACE